MSTGTTNTIRKRDVSVSREVERHNTCARLKVFTKHRFGLHYCARSCSYYFILIPAKGIVGAAYATAAGRILQAAITVALIYVLLYRRSGRASSQSNEA
jgi:hypothetical protein